MAGKLAAIRDQIRDQIQFGGNQAYRLDKDACVLYGVKVMGSDTKNGKVYPKKARVLAAALFEGRQVNLNHAKVHGKTGQLLEDVKVQDRFGWLQDITHEEDGSYGSFHYLKSHAFTPQFEEMAQRRPEMCGLSVLGSCWGKSKDSSGRLIVESIDMLNSVDLVADPASTSSLRDSVALSDAEPPQGEVAHEEEAADDYAATGCLKAIEEILTGGGSDAEKLKLIKEHCEQHDALDGEEGEEEGVEESLKRKARAECTALCDSLKVEATEARLNILVHVPADKREAVVKQFKRSAAAKPAKSGSPVATEAVKDSKDSPAQGAAGEDAEVVADRLAQMMR